MAGGSADDILAEVFERLENDTTIALNLNLLTPVSDETLGTVPSVKSLQRKKKKHTERDRGKSSKKSKKQKNSDDKTTDGAKKTGKYSEEIKNPAKESPQSSAKKQKKSTRRSSKEKKHKKRKHRSSSRSHGKRRKIDAEDSATKNFSTETSGIEILPSASRPKEQRKNVDEMYDEYEQMVNANRNKKINAVPLESYLKSKGYLNNNSSTKTTPPVKDSSKFVDSSIEKRNSKSDAPEETQEVPLRKSAKNQVEVTDGGTKSVHSSKTTVSSRSFMPRNLKLKPVSSVTNLAIDKSSIPSLNDQQSEISKDNADGSGSTVEKLSSAVEKKDEISEEPAKNPCNLSNDKELETSNNVNLDEKLDEPNSSLQLSENINRFIAESCSKILEQVKPSGKEADDADSAVQLNFPLTAPPLKQQRLVIGISDKTKNLILTHSNNNNNSATTSSKPKKLKPTVEDGEILRSEPSSDDSDLRSEIDGHLHDDSEGELKDSDEEKQKNKKRKHKNKKRKKSDKPDKELKTTKRASSVTDNSVDKSSSAERPFEPRYVDRHSLSKLRPTMARREHWSLYGESSRKYSHHRQRSQSPAHRGNRRRSDSREDRYKRSDEYRQHDYRSNRDSRDKDDKYRRRDRTPNRDESVSRKIDKKFLYDIARRNVSAMLQQGTIQQVCSLTAEEIAKLKAGGTSVDELVAYCRKLQKKEKKGENGNSNSSSSSDNEIRKSDNENDTGFRHPFALNPQKIVFNVKNFAQIPVKTPAERVVDEGKLKTTFPVSSGQHHRAKEVEWRPVSPPRPVTESATTKPSVKKVDMPKPIFPPSVVSVEQQTPQPEQSAVQMLPLPPPPPPPDIPDQDRVFPETSKDTPPVDIGEVVTSRLKAIRRLYENPNDIEALKMMHFAEEEMKKWAESKNVPGAYVGGTGAVCLTPSQLAPHDPKFQAWSKKDLLTNTRPVQSGVGMNLLQKMGWKPGEGLGKNNTGTLQPLLLDVKQDRKGLVSNEELTRHGRPIQGVAASKDLQGRHPVSVLMELCAKRRWNPPSFACVETGPSHNRKYLWKVTVNGVEYQPATASNNKKIGKSQSAQVVLQSLGLVPRNAALPIVIG